MQENKFNTVYKFQCMLINKDWEILILKDKIGDSKKRKFRSVNYKATKEMYTKQDIIKQIKHELNVEVKEEDIKCVYKCFSGNIKYCNVVNKELYYVKFDIDCSNIKFNKEEIENVYFLTLKELGQISRNTSGGYNYVLPELMDYEKIPEAPKFNLTKLKEEPLTQKVINILHYDDTHKTKNKEAFNSNEQIDEDEEYEQKIILEEEEKERQYQLDNDYDEEYENEFEGQRLLDEAEEIYEEEATDIFYNDDYNDTIWD